MSGNFAIKGGGVGRLMANAILNFHFDFLNPSLTLNQFNQGQVRVVLVCVLICLGLLMLAALHLDTRSSPAQACDCPEEKQAPLAAASKLEPASGHKLCLIVPFKDRWICKRIFFTLY